MTRTEAVQDLVDNSVSPNGRLFQVDGNGLSTIRTPSQVLAVAYGSSTAGTRSGGFFPNGVNGTIVSV